jgi:hypothetical protein
VKESIRGSPAERLRAALDLADSAEEIMRQNLKRRHPDASSAEIEERFLTWVRERARRSSELYDVAK